MSEEGAARQITVARLAELGIVPDTRLGQHFLVDDNLVRTAIRLARLAPEDVAVEVGPGLGVLTAALADTCSHVHAVEIDRRLEEALTRTLTVHPNVSVHWADALRLDLGALEPPATAFVSNLPYHVATPLIMESLAGIPGLRRWCVMVQREVADRFFASPRTRAYGAVSVLLTLACRETGRHAVSRHVFAPPPRVDSTLLAFERSAEWPTLAPSWPWISRVVHGAFAQRRKTLANSLRNADLAPRGATESFLAGHGHTSAARAEELAPAELAALALELAADR